MSRTVALRSGKAGKAKTASLAGMVTRPPRTAQRLCKRSLDIVLASLALSFFGPAMFFTAILIWIGGGPALFRHERIGLDGKPFNCLKFRTMCVDADAKLTDLLARDPEAAREWQLSRKLRHDPRVTWIGRFLRRSSIDELPQLLNVLRGDMSLVGPRPIVRAEIERYGEHFDAYASVPPGITGLWQISGRSQTSYEERVRLDLAYVQGWSLMGDILIIAKTIPAVLQADGAA